MFASSEHPYDSKIAGELGEAKEIRQTISVLALMCYNHNHYHQHHHQMATAGITEKVEKLPFCLNKVL
ncbi:hypothetical protein BV898_02123 [Hypsibius exemplaris]|uniref:Uncharacterized protein n=1 Tax=Hypsibius exemplaris TaxID=2072580 RepID=A0A1W0X9V0_HYPEX|nr:hypothetical protein BV898_02123 [Hypsibius exemplaris]